MCGEPIKHRIDRRYSEPVALGKVLRDVLLNVRLELPEAGKPGLLSLLEQSFDDRGTETRPAERPIVTASCSRL